VKDLATAKQVMTRLRALGIQLTLDDFGTGYSSVYHLKELPFDRRKIDRSFAHAVAEQPDSKRYLAAIAGLGRSLKLEVTAEGIEDGTVLQHMTALGCTYGQGFLFGRPVPVEELRADFACDVPAGAEALPGQGGYAHAKADTTATA
jgi:EAL domain-containing protein (putative c-di-GMP-specific phosphodiesterase class I)